MEGVEQPVDLRAGQAEYGVDAMRDKTVDDGFAAGSGSHAVVQSLIELQNFVDHAVAQQAYAFSLDLDDVARLEVARRVESRPGPGRRARDDDVASYQRREGRDVVDEIAETEDQPPGAVV